MSIESKGHLLGPHKNHSVIISSDGGVQFVLEVYPEDRGYHDTLFTPRGNIFRRITNPTTVSGLGRYNHNLFVSEKTYGIKEAIAGKSNGKLSPATLKRSGGAVWREKIPQLEPEVKAEEQ